MPPLKSSLNSYIPILILITLLPITALFDQPTIGLIIHGAAIYLLSRKSLRLTLCIAFPIYSLWFASLSNLMIEKGGYILEQFRYGELNGATSFISFYSLIFITTAHLILSTTLKSRGHSETNIKSSYGTLKITILCLITVYILIMLTYGTALSNGQDRFSYWSKLPDTLAQIVKNMRALHGPLTGIAGYIFTYLSRKEKKHLSILLILLHSILFLLGDKLTPFFNASFFFITGYAIAAIHNKENIKINISLILKIIFASLSLIGILAAGFILQQNIRPSILLIAFEQRMILQGHVWYGIFDIVREKGSILATSKLLNPNSLDNPSGLDALSYMVSEENFVYDRIKRGITFTMGGPAAALAIGGVYVGSTIYAILAIPYALAIYYTSLKLKNGQFFRSLTALTFLISLNSIVLMGNWYSIYNSASLIFFAILLADMLIKGKNIKPFLRNSI